MGGVFAAASQAPLTAIASVAEMTANFGLTLPIMLACGIAAALSKQLSYGSIYTTKLLRRGIDIERPRTTSVLHALTVADVMQPVSHLHGDTRLLAPDETDGHGGAVSRQRWERIAGPVTDTRAPQELFGDETLEQALRQLVIYGRDGLPVVSHDGGHLQGWITRHNVLGALAQSVNFSTAQIEQGAVAADFAVPDPQSSAHTPSTPLSGYEIVEITTGPGSPALDRRVEDISLPPGSRVVAVTQGREIVAPHNTPLRAGDKLIVLAPAEHSPRQAPDATTIPKR
jgi:CIC family chloride channel protein